MVLWSSGGLVPWSSRDSISEGEKGVEKKNIATLSKITKREREKDRKRVNVIVLVVGVVVGVAVVVLVVVPVLVVVGRSSSSSSISSNNGTTHHFWSMLIERLQASQ